RRITPRLALRSTWNPGRRVLEPLSCELPAQDDREDGDETCFHGLLPQGMTRCCSKPRALSRVSAPSAGGGAGTGPCRRAIIHSGTGRYGFVPWLDPANSLCPGLINTNDRALPSKLPSLARLPSTVTASPIFTELGVQP